PPPVPHDGGQTRDGAYRHSAAGVTLQTVIHANERRARSAVRLRERHHRLLRQPRDRRDTRGRIVTHALPQRLLAQRVSREKVTILEPALEDHVHHAERQRRVGARANRDPLVALRGRGRADGSDRDHPRPPFTPAEDGWPRAWIRMERNRSP